MLLRLWDFSNIPAVMIAGIFSWVCWCCWGTGFIRPVSWLGNPDGMWAEIFSFAYATGKFCSHGGVFLHFASSWCGSEPSWTVHDDLLSSLNFPKGMSLFSLHSTFLLGFIVLLDSIFECYNSISILTQENEISDRH